ncbi:glycoside hydrolase family 20 zincin-like fold domain-containing protein, partial [Streptomyces sp. NPDC056121]
MTGPNGIDPAWLPDEALRGIGSRRVLIEGDGPLVDTLRAEVAHAQRKFGASQGDGDVAFRLDDDADTGPEGFTLTRSGGRTTVTAAAPAGLLYGFFHVVRLGAAAFDDAPEQTHRPALSRRMLNHWDNIDVHPVMGQVERGYAGGSLFWD